MLYIGLSWGVFKQSDLPPTDPHYRILLPSPQRHILLRIADYSLRALILNAVLVLLFDAFFKGDWWQWYIGIGFFSIGKLGGILLTAMALDFWGRGMASNET